jgi:hypothetical protein
VACAADPPPDLLMVHDPWAARAALADGCAPAAISGHMHSRSNPRVLGEGVAYTQSSTGRDTANGTTVGPLANPAEITIMLFDQDNRWVAWQLLTIRPDASAELSPIKAVPSPAPEEAASPEEAATPEEAASPR